MALDRAKVHRNAGLRQSWLGLEPLDWIGLGFVLLLFRIVNRHALGWQILVLVLAFSGLRLIKRGRPDHFTTALIRFYLRRRPFFSATAKDTKHIPFPTELKRTNPTKKERT
jgi:hypothetical protein